MKAACLSALMLFTAMGGAWAQAETGIDQGITPEDCRAQLEGADPANAPKDPAGIAGNSLSNQLDACNSVLLPPATGDTELTTPPPATGATPVIPPGALPEQPAQQE